MSVLQAGHDSKFELVIGLEVHVQLATKSKIFSNDSAGFGSEPNTNISAVSLGLPGTLPKLNRQVVEYAVKMGLATNCTINRQTHFDRKNYFYADLPKGFQTTQDNEPICVGGFIDVPASNSGVRKVRINRIHMEDDAGKSMHDQHDESSLIDLNRAGVPLIEIVSEPDIRSASEAAAYLQEIRKLVRYLGISDGNMEEGSIRCDANISLRRYGSTEYGNRCEVKNLNSVRNLQRAIDHEYSRQSELIEAGIYVDQNTLNFDAETGVTSPLRSKEMANDYRYFPEPDLPSLSLTEEFINQIKASIPELPAAKTKRYVLDLELSEYDANLLTIERSTSEYFESVCEATSNYKAAANWVNGPIRSWLNDSGKNISDFPATPAQIAAIISMIDQGLLNNSSATQKLLPALLESPAKNPRELAESLQLLIDTDDQNLEMIIGEVLDVYPEKVREYHRGKRGVVGLFMGDVMKKSRGKINPQAANKLLLEILESKK